MYKKSKIVLLLTIVVSSSIAIGVIFSSANKETSYQNEKNHLRSKIADNNREIKFEKVYELDNHKKDKKIKLLEFSDTKYKYVTLPNTGEIQMIKDLTLTDSFTKASGNLSKELAIEKASQFVSKFDVQDNNRKEYILSDYSKKVDNYFNIHCINLDGVTKSGKKTGDSILVWINQQGELVMYSKHKGNASVAENTNPVVSENKAIEIATLDIVNKNPFLNDKHRSSIHASKIELTVFEDKLVYSIEFKDIFKQFNEPDFNIGYIIDAITGDIILQNNTK